MSTHPSASTRARRRHRRAVAAIGIVVLMIAATACFSLDPKSGSGNGMAYITEPASNQLHIVDYETGSVWKSIQLSQTPIEMAVVTG